MVQFFYIPVNSNFIGDLEWLADSCSDLGRVGWIRLSRYRKFLVSDGSKTDFSGCSSAWLERTVRDGEAGGSNPLTPILGSSSALEIYPF